ncbi:hypothetical protein HYX00_03585 [Candidatus Woesearchaeota archaeon]|nr:hypothetical protein [Candidatus Woesearchaeota archaeon]
MAELKRLEAVFPDEREARIARGLLMTLKLKDVPIRVFQLLQMSLDDVCRLVGEDYRTKKDGNYEKIINELSAAGYIGLQGFSGEKRCIEHPTDWIQMNEGAKKFFEEKYSN